MPVKGVTPTELEHCVLGVVWRRGPCSAYAVRNEFARSPSAYWSTSAGSIYPVVERLVSAGLVSSRPTTVGARGSRALELTDEGRRTLRGWVAHVDPLSTTATYDGVRTKFTFIDALPSRDERRRVIDQTIAHTSIQIDELRRREGDPGETLDAIERISMRGARYELEGRRRWLLEIADELVQVDGPAGSLVGGDGRSPASAGLATE